ncbi:hypothetical protein [Micromonospora radicis]|uniref:Uncharacterized protein n=1 Tax=Micromonospora radicis TaxID=1894971 RepID=A0A418MP51_9ACTN|nr:hypothetical protein [Micromonospora radicis]RIV34336.1 hypothetical protein D2L64_23420 [Micromonospora radicis]
MTATGARFATEFDEPPTPRGLPAVFSRGGDPDVLVADRMTRGTGILGRIQAASGAVMLKVRTDGRPVRVRVDLHVDSAAQASWSRAATPGRGERELPRLVMVRAQGTARAAVLINRQRGRLRMVEAHAWVEFDLGPDEMGPDELLIIELADPAVPRWAEPAFSPLAPIGVRINEVEVTARADADETAATTVTGPAAQLAGLASAGGLVGARGRTEGRPRTRFVVVNVPAPTVRCRLRIATASTPPAAFRHPTGDWLRRQRGQTVLKAVRVARRGAGYALFEASPFTRPPHPDRLVVHAANLVDGTACPVRATAQTDDVLDVSVERTAPGPVLIGLAEPAAPAVRRRLAELVCQVVEVAW